MISYKKYFLNITQILCTYKLSIIKKYLVQELFEHLLQPLKISDCCKCICTSQDHQLKTHGLSIEAVFCIDQSHIAQLSTFHLFRWWFQLDFYELYERKKKFIRFKSKYILILDNNMWVHSYNCVSWKRPSQNSLLRSMSMASSRITFIYQCYLIVKKSRNNLDTACIICHKWTCNSAYLIRTYFV